MRRVVFMCGPAGSGKSTKARELEALGMTRLSFDVEAWRRGHRRMPLPDDVRRDIDRALREKLLAHLDADRDVVLDFSFWSRSMRDDWRRLVAERGITPEVVYLDTPREVVLARIRDRATRHDDDFELDEATAAGYFDGFEVPTTDEGPLTIVSFPESA